MSTPKEAIAFLRPASGKVREAYAVVHIFRFEGDKVSESRSYGGCTSARSVIFSCSMRIFSSMRGAAWVASAKRSLRLIMSACGRSR